MLTARNILPSTLTESHKVFPTEGLFAVVCQANTEFLLSGSASFPTKTSISSNFISPSSIKNFTMVSGVGLTIPIGAKVKVAYTLDATNKWMAGYVYSYNSTTGVLRVIMVAATGSGTYTNWTISQYYDEPWAGSAGSTLQGVAISGSMKLRATSSATLGGTVAAGVTIGADVYSWTVRTYSSPFQSVYGASGEVESEVFTIASTALYYTVVGGEVSVNGGAYETSGYNAAVTTMQVKVAAAGSSLTLKIGATAACQDAWYTFDTYAALDLPYPSEFTAPTTAVSTLTESAKASFDLSPDAIICPYPGVELSANRGQWTDEPFYHEGGYLVARFRSSDSASTTTTKYIEVDGTDYPFALTTAAHVTPTPRDDSVRLSKRVVYRTTSIRQLVKQVEPKPPDTVVYEFSNGRQFKERP